MKLISLWWRRIISWNWLVSLTKFYSKDDVQMTGHLTFKQHTKTVWETWIMVRVRVVTKIPFQKYYFLIVFAFPPFWCLFPQLKLSCFDLNFQLNRFWFGSINRLLNKSHTLKITDKYNVNYLIIPRDVWWYLS